MYVCIYVHMHVFVCACLYLEMHRCMHVCLYECLYISFPSCSKNKVVCHMDRNGIKLTQFRYKIPRLLFFFRSPYISYIVTSPFVTLLRSE